MSKPPTHRLKVKERNGEGRCTIGVGWLNADGSMSVQLNPCVVLTSRDDVVINLFPIDEDTPRPASSSAAPSFPKEKLSGTVIPKDKSNGHDFVEIGTHGKDSIHRCTKCDHRVAVNVPFNGIRVEPCRVVEDPKS